MTIKALIPALALVLAGAAQPAFAGSLGPPNTFSTWAGSAAFQSGALTVNCNLTLNVLTDAAGNARVTSASASGNFLCPAYNFSTYLPWPITVTGPNQISINTMGFNSPVMSCGPATTPATVSFSGSTVDIFPSSLPPSCTVRASLNAFPPVTVVWP